MAFRLEDLNYEKDSKERMPWEHYLEQYKEADQKRSQRVFPFLLMRKRKNLR